ncbi:MAG: hypothetical protein L6V83_05500 [Christensenella sp.]|nr:MAG: hypothetical protein L6V83_05500 [Christensenella sp.]
MPNVKFTPKKNEAINNAKSTTLVTTPAMRNAFIVLILFLQSPRTTRLPSSGYTGKRLKIPSVRFARRKAIVYGYADGKIHHKPSVTSASKRFATGPASPISTLDFLSIDSFVCIIAPYGKRDTLLRTYPRSLAISA